MNRKYSIITNLVKKEKISQETASKAISLAEESGMPSLYHLINDCCVSPDAVSEELNNCDSGQCICPKCDGAGFMLFGKGDGSCHLCEQAGVVSKAVAFGWLDKNKCIPGF